MSPAERQAPQLRVQRWIGVDGGNLASGLGYLGGFDDRHDNT